MKQSIKNGTKVTFNARGMEGEFEDVDLNVEPYENKEAIVEYLETYAELGDQDSEYYTIKFEDGFIINGCSGYHLTKIQN